MTLALKRVQPDDYDVISDGETDGRIYRMIGDEEPSSAFPASPLYSSRPRAPLAAVPSGQATCRGRAREESTNAGRWIATAIFGHTEECTEPKMDRMALEYRHLAETERQIAEAEMRQTRLAILSDRASSHGLKASEVATLLASAERFRLLLLDRRTLILDAIYGRR
jgi:hypothetical protein